MKTKQRSAASIIAMWFCTDGPSVSEGKYHHGRTNIPVYVLGNDYYCCPTAGGKPATHRDGDSWDWKPIGELYDRTIYCAKA